MSWITATDPLALLATQAGVGTPSVEAGAAGGGDLNTQQRSIKLGEPVPVVFARRRNNQGGILISPGATEARFENNTSNEVTAFYHLVLSDGLIDDIQVRDVFQRNCRRGSFSQNYNVRAGTWAPGNIIVQRSGFDLPQCPQYCGTVGSYTGISTMSYQYTAPEGSDEWNRQVHVLIRGGIRVTRLYDNTLGPSDNFCDVVRWAMVNSGRVPESLLDIPALTSAAAFLETQQFFCNSYFQQSTNLPDLIASLAQFFLLRETSVNGLKGFRPVLPTSNGQLITTAVTAKYLFDDDLIIPGSLEINYTSLVDRQPVIVQVTWRQQSDDDAGIIRTSEILYAGQSGGPYESHDLSAFCTNERHAVKVGAYILSKRTRTLHTIRFAARPQTHSKTLGQGDIVQVKITRKVQNAGSDEFNYLYQIDRISKTLAGDVSYECSHFPIDSQGRSLIALDVESITPTGLIIASNQTGPSCDLNSKTNTTVPAKTSRGPDANYGPSVMGGGGGGGERPPGTPAPQPDDGLDRPPTPLDTFPTGAPLTPGSALVIPADEPCGPGVEPEWRWLKDGEPVPERKQKYYVIGTAEILTHTPGTRTPAMRGQLRCPGGDWQDFEPTDLPETAPTAEWEYYINSRSTTPWYGFGPPGTWKSGWFDDVPYVKTVGTFGSLIEVELWAPKVSGPDVKLGTELVEPDKPLVVQVLKSRRRESPSSPWVETDYSSL